MPTHKPSSERTRTTPRFDASWSAEEAFARHDAFTLRYTDALREGRCKPTRRFGASTLRGRLAALKPISGAWTLELLFALHVHGDHRFNDLKRLAGPISSRVLTDKLRAMTESGLVEREEAEDRVTYRLSPRGALIARHLHPVVFFLNHGEP